MEVKRKEKTLAGLFLKYVVLFCVNTILLAAGVFLLVICLSSAGLLLPANYAEVQLSEDVMQIRGAGDSLEQWIPQGCTYGVYNADGVWLRGNFPVQEQKSAWDHYEKNTMYAEYKGYYRFVPMDDRNICIVKYHLIMRFSNEKLNELLPAPELLMPILDIILFILNAVLLSKRFAGKVKAQLRELHVITEKISQNDLEFETKTSELKEINEIMASLGRMKDTLKDSLTAQWDMEKQKQEQLSALAHDIKTPLTIIRGNTELLKEREQAEEENECVEYILGNVEEIEKYLENMRQVIYGDRQGTEQVVLRCESLKETFRETAKQLSAAEKIPISFDVMPFDGRVRCKEEEIL
ncbi:MAG: sensor histidine kinase, partial [Lachnospiraceae bacterium]|nr:sensor histidine kinase [Lachnospiraceae bacterium]